MSGGRPKTKEDAYKIRRVTIELGTDRGADTIIEIHPPSQTVEIRGHWPLGAFAAERMPLDAMVDALHALLKSKRAALSAPDSLPPAAP